MSSESTAALLTTSSPEEIGRAGEGAAADARALVESIKVGGLAPILALDAYDEAMAALGNASDRVDLIANTHPDEAMRDAADAAKQALAKVRTDISLDRGLYDVLAGLVQKVADLPAQKGASQEALRLIPKVADLPAQNSASQEASRPDLAELDAATRYYLDRTLREFRRAGVDQDDETRERVRVLQEELVEIGQAFDRNIRTDTRTAALPPSALAGLPADYVRAHPPGEDGLVSISTDYPDIVPFMMYSSDAAAREQLWRLYRQRGYPSNLDVLHRMLHRRHDLATLLGYPSWAQYVAEDKMIGSAQNIADFIEKIAAAAAERSSRDYQRLLARKRIDSPDAAAVLPWDTAYLDDRVKAEELALDSQALRPYFEYGRVKAGLMAISSRLFGVRFRRRTDIPVWHPDVECYEVDDATGTIGRIFLDMHPRDNKYNHAAAFTLTTGKAGVRIPECALVCNLPQPGAEPALLQHSDVRTFFHEFGHLIHGIFGGATRWHGISGIATEWDFVEAPSQLLEEWVRDADTLATFAVHHETGEVLPADLVARLRAADEFGKGLQVRQQMFYASLSFELHQRDPHDLDPVAVEKEAMERLTPFRHVDGTWMHLSFGHLEGYSAIYCTYMWSLVIAKDLFTVFEREGLDSVDAAGRYRGMVLAAGGSAPAAELVAGFLGRPYSFDAYQRWLDQE